MGMLTSVEALFWTERSKPLLVARVEAERVHEVRADQCPFEVVESGGCQKESSNANGSRNLLRLKCSGLTWVQGEKFTLFRTVFVTAVRFQ